MSKMKEEGIINTPSTSTKKNPLPQIIIKKKSFHNY